MSSEIKVFSACFLALGLSQYGVSQAKAQSGTNNNKSFTDARLNALQFRNSASRFSSRQYQNMAYASAVPRLNYRSVNQNIFKDARARTRQKPFSGVTKGPSVTPYLGLAGLQTGGAPNYYSNVKPRLEQQRQNQEAQRRNMAMQQQLNQIAARAPYSTRGSETMAPTGHTSAFMNLGGYYPVRR